MENLTKLTLIYLTIFPSYFDNYFQISLAKKALEKHIVKYEVYNLRNFAKKKQVDDYPYGGGPGMLLKIEPLVEAIETIKNKYPESYFIFLSPQGKRLTQKDTTRLLKNKNLIFICGHYEGVDTRILYYINEQLSLGDFVTMGGEIPALAVTEVLLRAIPTFIKKKSYQEESFIKNKFDFDSYTRPMNFRGLVVPPILLSGNHKKIEEWKKNNIEEKNQKLKTTKKN